MTQAAERIQRMKAQYPDADERHIINYLDLRDEGHSQYQALIMSGLSDPEAEEGKRMNKVRRCGSSWRVVWKGSMLAPLFNSQGAADAYLDGLYKGRTPV